MGEVTWEDLYEDVKRLTSENVRLKTELELMAGDEKPRRAIRPHNFQVIRGGKGEVGDD